MEKLEIFTLGGLHLRLKGDEFTALSTRKVPGIAGLPSPQSTTSPQGVSGRDVCGRSGANRGR